MQLSQTFDLVQRLTIKPFYSVFKKFEDLLESDDDYTFCIRIVAQNKKIDKYADIIDFTFIELFPEWKAECFRYYDGRAVLLKDHPVVTKKKIKAWDEYLCNSAEAAKIFVEEKYVPPWRSFRMTCYAAGGGKNLSIPKKKIIPTVHLVHK